MKATIAGYALVLCAALIGAYQTWTHEGDPDPSEATVILEVEREELESIVFEGPQGTLELELREDQLGPFVWAVHTPKPSADASDAPVEPSAFKVGPAGEAWLEGMAPFTAKRVLEGVDDSKLDELGFGDEQATLTLHRADGSAASYDVASKVYGGRIRYVRDPESGTVYVVGAAVIEKLETGRTTLPDRSLVVFGPADIQMATVRAGEAEATYVQHNPDDREANYWAVEGSTEPNAVAKGWFGKAFDLRINRYLAPSETPEGLEEAFSMALKSGPEASEVVVYRAYGEDGQQTWFASSPHHRTMVELSPSTAAQAAADVASVLEGGA